MSGFSLGKSLRLRRRYLWLTIGLLLVAAVALSPLLLSRVAGNVGLLLLNRALARQRMDGELAGADLGLMDAEQWLQRAKELDEANTGAWRGLGFLYWAIGYRSEALGAWHKVGTMSDEFVSRGETLRPVQPDEAEIWLRRALDLDPHLCAARMQLGLLYRERGRLADAALEYAACVNTAPYSIEAHTGECYAWLSADEPDRALESYRSASPQLKEQASMLACAGVAYRDKRDYDNAAAYMERASRSVPEDGHYHQWLSLIYAEQGRFDTALAQSLIAIDLDPARADFWRQLGAVHLALGHRDEAIFAFRSATEIDPDDEAARRALATLGIMLP